MKKIALLLVLTMLVSNITVNAAPIFTVDYNPSNDKITISGTAEGITTVRVTNEAVVPDDLSDSNLPSDFFQVISDGSLKCEFYVPLTMQSLYGKYNIYLTDEDGAYSEAFIYFDKDIADAIINGQVNPAGTKDEFLQAVVPNAAALGIDCANPDYNENSLHLMYSLYESYSDSSDFVEKYAFCRAVYALKNKSNEDVKNVLKKYENILKISYKTDFEENAVLSAAAKEKLCELLSKISYADVYAKAEQLTGKSGFEAVYAAYSALAATMVADNWKTTEKIYTQDFSFLKANVVDANTSYTSINASNVFISLARKSFADIDDLKENFDASVTDSQNDNNNPNQNNQPTVSVPIGGGGGGGGSQPFEETDSDTETIMYKMPSLMGSAEFIDVPQNAWYKEAVSILGGSKIISGDEDGKFRPESNITRAEFAKLVVSAFSIESNGQSFTDVTENAWYAPYIKKASGAGIISGYDGKFRPNDYISRQDAAVIIYRTAKLLDVQYIGFQESTDMSDVSLYAMTAVGALYSNSVIAGVGGGKFAPLENITRAQAAQLLYSTIIDIQNRL